MKTIIYYFRNLSYRLPILSSVSYIWENEIGESKKNMQRNLLDFEILRIDLSKY